MSFFALPSWVPSPSQAAQIVPATLRFLSDPQEHVQKDSANSDPAIMSQYKAVQSTVGMGLDTGMALLGSPAVGLGRGQLNESVRLGGAEPQMFEGTLGDIHQKMLELTPVGDNRDNGIMLLGLGHLLCLPTEVFTFLLDHLLLNQARQLQQTNLSPEQSQQLNDVVRLLKIDRAASVAMFVDLLWYIGSCAYMVSGPDEKQAFMALSSFMVFNFFAFGAKLYSKYNFMKYEHQKDPEKPESAFYTMFAISAASYVASMGNALFLFLHSRGLVDTETANNRLLGSTHYPWAICSLIIAAKSSGPVSSLTKLRPKYAKAISDLKSSKNKKDMLQSQANLKRLRITTAATMGFLGSYLLFYPTLAPIGLALATIASLLLLWAAKQDYQSVFSKYVEYIRKAI